MANFEPSYPKVRKAEGFYSNASTDKGGETYAGVSRKHHPLWKGWVFVDREKHLKGGFLKWNHRIDSPELEQLIKEFYRQYWNDAKAGEIKDQALADIFFDHAVNAGTPRAAKLLQKSLVQMGYQVTIDSAIGPKTLAIANVANTPQLHDVFKAQREIYYRSIANGNEANIDGWLARLSHFPDLFSEGVKKKVA